MFGLLLTRRDFLQLSLVSILWGYDGDQGPAHWSTLSSDYHICGDGQRQSPIKIDKTTATEETVSFDYWPMPISLLNNGRTIQETGNDRCSLTVDDQVYNLSQFHFHTPSEHTDGGAPYPMELHLVHRHPDTQALAVVGVWITPGLEQPELAVLSLHLPKQSGEQISASAMVNPGNLLPTERTLVRYSGSLTTPPCSEGVTWLMMANPIEASAQQIAMFHQLLGNNARPLQRPSF
ncbi:carbonic anhydrase [Leptolyngbya sp. PCC 7375]|nr:carbonic anhydrase [Leptolyngbya sp. PCC 7375]